MFRRRLPGLQTLAAIACSLVLYSAAIGSVAALVGAASDASAQAVTLHGAAPAVSDNAETPAVGAPRLRWIERRRLGLTVKNVRKALEELKAEGKLSAYVETTEDGAREIQVSSLAVAVADKLAAERPAEWGENIDWDQVLAWIEQILELLIKYIPIILDLFTVNVATAPAVAVCPAPVVLAA